VDTIETTTASSSSATRQIARAAGTVMIAFIISNLIGLVRGILIYRAFGTSSALDSFTAANRVTEVIYNLMAGGALGSAFIPTFTGFLARNDRAGANRLASSVANILLVALSLVCVVAAIFAPQLVRYGLFVLDPTVNPGQQELTVTLLRILLPSVAIFGLSGLAMGILNANQTFLVPAVAPAMYSIGMILGVLVFPSSMGIFRLAWGALLGSLLHLLVQLPALFKHQFHYSFTFGWKVPAVREVIRLFGPRVFGVAVVQLNFIVNTIVALSQPEGSASAIALAFSLMLMPEMAIAQSIAIASLPTFSAQVALGKLDDMRSSLASSLRGVLLLAFPAAVGLILMREPLIRFLYENGTNFTAHSTELVSWALLWYAAGLIGHSVVEITSRAFYALHDTRTPVTIGVVAMGLNVGFSFLFSYLFTLMGWFPHGGLALANSLATALEMAGLLYMMRRKLNGLEGGHLWQAVWQAGLAALVMGVSVWGWLQVSPSRPWLVALGGVAVGTAVYALMMFLLRVKELNQLLPMAKSLLRRLKPGS
jgi:putative peptidoglycan lipid II flippase